VNQSETKEVSYDPNVVGGTKSIPNWIFFMENCSILQRTGAPLSKTEQEKK
jgi:hypothetical protein